MAEIFQVLQIVSPDGRPSGKYRYTRHSDEGYDIFGLCDHEHGSVEEAENCPDARATLDREFPKAPSAPEKAIDIDALVQRFLAWPLPKSVCADLCATNPNYPHPRSGTNLLTAVEARQLFEYLFSAPPTA